MKKLKIIKIIVLLLLFTGSLLPEIVGAMYSAEPSKSEASIFDNILAELILEPLEEVDDRKMVALQEAEEHQAKPQQHIGASLSAEQYSTMLQLQPHPEGGYYKSTYLSEDKVTPKASRYAGEDRHAGTSIYYLLDKQNFSAWHRLKSDEIWHYYDGCPMNVYIIDASGNFQTITLGNPSHNVAASFQALVKAGNWFAAELTDKTSFCLVGCDVYPGFEYKDFELADKATIAMLAKLCPTKKYIIQRLAHPDTKVENSGVKS